MVVVVYFMIIKYMLKKHKSYVKEIKIATSQLTDEFISIL